MFKTWHSFKTYLLQYKSHLLPVSVVVAHQYKALMENSSPHEMSLVQFPSSFSKFINQVLSFTNPHTPLTALFPEIPGWAGTRKVKPIWISLKQETVSGSGISWAICKSASRSRQITTPAPHHSVFYRPDALPAPNQQRQSTEGRLSVTQYAANN